MAPAVVFAGVPYGWEFEQVQNVLEQSGFRGNDVIVMSQLTESGTSFTFDIEAADWVEEAANGLLHCFEGEDAAVVGAFAVVAQGRFLLQSIPRPYVLFLRDNGTLVAGDDKGDSNLVAVEMSEWKVAELEEDIFKRCSKLRLVCLPISLESIGEEAFSWCEGLKSADVSRCPCLKRIGKRAFGGCILLPCAILPASTEVVEELAYTNSGLGEFDLSLCPLASFYGAPLAGALVNKIVTGWFDFRRVCDTGPDIVMGTCFTDFTVECGTSASENDVRKGLIGLERASGSPSFTLRGDNGWEESFQEPQHGEITKADACREVMLQGRQVADWCRRLRGAPLRPNVYALCLSGLSPKELPGICAEHVPDLREVFLPGGLLVLPEYMLAEARRLKRVVLGHPRVLREIGNWSLVGCCALGTLDIPATVTKVGRMAFEDSGIKHLNVEELKLTEADFCFMPRLETLILGPSVAGLCFPGAACLRSLTFGRMLLRGEGCGGHVTDARCMTFSGRFPDSLESVLERAHVFGELAAAALVPSRPALPP
jgi:hypothetical protein